MSPAINAPRFLFCSTLILVVGGFLMFAGLRHAIGQEVEDSGAYVQNGEHTHHPAKDMLLHEKFYQHWSRPDYRDDKGQRTSSCCDKRDCYPTVIKKVNGEWAARRREDGVFIPVPDKVLEQKQDDEVEAPDGQSHVCMNPQGYIFCATLGSGQ